MRLSGISDEFEALHLHLESQPRCNPQRWVWWAVKGPDTRVCLRRPAVLPYSRILLKSLGVIYMAKR
jgi:hypothetical protein